MSVIIHGSFSLESVSGVRFQEVSDIFGPQKLNQPRLFYDFFMEKLASFLAPAFCVVGPLQCG